jgi:hypothetical protein
VSGAASNGGTNAFSTVMAQTVVGSHQLTIAEMPSHSHSIPGFVPNALDLQFAGGGGQGGQGVGTSTDATGGGGAHNHTISMNVAYVDVILAVKD